MGATGAAAGGASVAVTDGVDVAGANATRVSATGVRAVTGGVAGALSDERTVNSFGLETFVSCVVSVTTGIPAVATATVLGVAAGRSARMLPSHAIRLESANPRTKEITREVESEASIRGLITGHGAGVTTGSE